MKSILLTVAMLVTTLTAAAQWMKPTVESKGDFVVGDTVYLYNTGAQMFLTQGNAYGTQASVADEGLMLKVEPYVESEGAEWDGKTYTVRDYRPVQKDWFYVFVDDQGGCYMDRASQPDYLWELDKQDDGSYRIRCAAANPAFNPATYPNCYAGVVSVGGELRTWVNPLIDLNEMEEGTEYYLDWMFFSKKDYAPYAEELKRYRATMKLRETLDECINRNIDVEELEQLYANTDATLEELAVMQKQADALISANDEQNVTPDNPVDFTERIVNPDFESTEGWTKEGAAKTFEVNGWVPAVVEEAMIAPALNLWGNNQDIYVSQKVENVPNGIYKFSAGVYSQANGPFIEANGAKAAVTTGGPTAYEVLTYVSDNTITLAIGFPAEGTQWVMGDCFRLKYFGNGYEAYKMWVDETLSGASDFEDAACYRPLKDNYDTSLGILTAAESQEVLTAELPNFLTLFDELKANVAAYVAYQTLTDDAMKMVMDDSYAGDEFDVLSDYVAGETYPGDEFENGSAQYILKNGNLNTEDIEKEAEYLKQLVQSTIDNCMAVGADATAKMVNPNFDEGLSGWIYNKKLGTPSPGGMTTNPNVERWNENFDFYQEVNLPNGVYRVDAQAFYRTAANGVAVTEWLDGSAEVLTELYANTGHVNVVNVYSQAQASGFYKEDNAYPLNDGTEVPNSMKTTSEAFTAELYQNSLTGVVWNGKLRVGIRSLNASATDRWSIWDNFRLTFMGYEAEPIEECHKQTLAEAEELLNGDLTDEMKDNLSATIQLAVDYADGRSTLEVIAKIREAMDEANSYLTGINQHPATAQTATVAAIYNLKGMRLNALQKGVNIVRMSDNTTKKIMVK